MAAQQHRLTLEMLVGGVVGGAVGSIITNEVYKSNRHSSHKHRSSRKKHYKKKKTSHRKSYAAPKMTDEKKIQKALTSLGFYHGKIDGEINSYETRSAIKEMNRAYEISSSASLKPEVKDTLIFLGTLFQLDRYLIARGTDQRTKNKKIQAALKIYGYYHGKIDGAVGKGTRSAISQYKADHGMYANGVLNFEEEYQLVSSAKEKNDKNIDDAISTFKRGENEKNQMEESTHIIKFRKKISNQPESTYEPRDTTENPESIRMEDTLENSQSNAKGNWE